MTNLICRCVTTICCSVVLISAAFSQTRTSNSIQGYIFDGVSRQPVADVYVELLNDTYGSLRRIKTDGSGRYYFGGLSEGRFKVKVLPYRFNYVEEIQDAEIVNFNAGRGNTSDTVYLDFYLKVDKKRSPIDSSGTVGAVFVQEIPKEARSFYEKGVANFEKPTEIETGFQNLTKAIEIFPDYYDALNRISFEYVRKDKFYESIPYLVRAVRVNQRSFSCYYMLGTAAHRLKQYKESAEAFRLASVLNPQSALTFVKYGMVLRIDGNYKAAEEALLRALSVAKEDPPSDAYWQLALLYDKTERFGEAAVQLEKYLAVQPDVENKAQIQALIVSMKAKAEKKKTS